MRKVHYTHILPCTPYHIREGGPLFYAMCAPSLLKDVWVLPGNFVLVEEALLPKLKSLDLAILPRNG